MKRIVQLPFLLVCLIMAMAPLSSCEFDTSPEPEHPTYVTYTITAGNISFSGPEQLLADIQQWIKSNQIVYDTEVHYSSGAASEFKNSDNEAISKYNGFVSKFTAYLKDVLTKLDSGAYGKNVKVTATFFVSASRLQGQDGKLKYEHLEFVYPIYSE